MPRKKSSNKLPVYPVTDADAAEFNRYLQQWRDKLNLRDWTVSLQDTRDRSNAALLVSADVPQRLAKFKVGTDLGDNTPVTPHELERIALHEMLHLLVAELIEVSMKERDPNDTVLAAEHRVVVVLTDLLMDAYGENRRPQPAQGTRNANPTAT